MQKVTTIQLVVYVIARNSKREVLMLRRSKTAPHRALTWDFPGGEVEVGEDPEVAAVREMMEEAGLEPRQLKPFSVSSHMGDEMFYVFIVYTAEVGSTDVNLSYEHDMYQWVTVEKMQDLDLPGRFQQVAEELLAAQ